MEFERAAAVQQEFQSTLNHNRSNGQANINSDELGILLRHLEELRAGSVDNSSNWLGNIIAENNKRKGSQAPATPDSRLIALLGYSYEVMRDLD